MLKIPYTQQFTPESTPLQNLIGILRKHQGKPKDLKKAIASAFFGGSSTPEKMAGNTLIAMKYHDIIDASTIVTPFGATLLNAPNAAKATELLAKNILLKLDGLALVETLREMAQGHAIFKLGTVTEELKLRGFEVSDNSSDLSGVLNWLREAGVLVEYRVQELRYSELVGSTPKIIDALKELTEPQILFLRALLALGTTEWVEHNIVVRHAESLYAGEVSYNWKDIDRTVLQPLAKTGLIEFRKGLKTSATARGGKPAEVKTTEKFEKEIAEPILEPMYKSAGFRDVRRIRSIPWTKLVADIKQRADENLRGEALEILAIRICQLLDLDFMGWRETDDELVGGGEVDGFMHTARLVYSRWQIQCKASDKISFESLAKEVGVAEITLANIILIVSTGTITSSAATYRGRIINKTPLNIVIIDGTSLDAIVKNPSAISSILKAQAQDALQTKPKPNTLIRKTNDGGDGGGDGGAATAEPAPSTQSQPSTAPAPESPGTLFKPYYTTPHGDMYLGDSYDVLQQLIREGVRAKLVFTSPPFALLRKKAYGNEDQEAYVSWFMRFAPLFHQILEPDGSFVMDIGGSWLPGIPARSVYQYKLLLRLCESDFYLAQEFYHYNPARLPSPAEWVTVRRIRVKDAMNNVWWFTKQPFVDSDNRRVLREYSDAMKHLLKNGYKAKMRPSGHDISKNFSNDRGGAIPSNLIQLSNTDSNGRYLKECARASIKPHPARFPAGLPDFFIRFLTRPGDLVVDPFAGSNVTGETAQSLGRRWIGVERDENYVKGSWFRFVKPAHPDLASSPKRRRQSPAPASSLLFLPPDLSMAAASGQS